MSGVSGISNNFSFQLMVGEELKLVESTVFEYGWMPEIGELKKDIEKLKDATRDIKFANGNGTH